MMEFEKKFVPDVMYFNPIKGQPGCWKMTPIREPGCVVFYKEEYAKTMIEREISSRIDKEKKRLNSEIGKIRMGAYNDAAKWNKAIDAKFDAMIKKASKTFFGRIIEKPIWKMMKRRWMSKRLAKEY